MSSIAEVAAQEAAAAAAAKANATTSQNALGTLSNNFGSFLQMLMTQLKHQDPTSPLDTNQFTTQLVQFSGVEQQISANSSLATLIQLTQSSQVVQSTQMLGHTVSAISTQMPLQSGAGSLQFTATTPEDVSIVVSNAQGQQLLATTVTAATGSNTWKWNGHDQSGATLPDGAYAVTVTGQNSDGSTTALPFTVQGKATGVTHNGNAVQLDLGSLAINFSAVTAVDN